MGCHTRGDTCMSGAANTGGYSLSDPVVGFVRPVRQLATSPAAFFRALPASGGLADSLAFAVLCYEAYALLGAVFGSAARGGLPDFIVLLLFVPLVGTVCLFPVAGVLHALVLIVAAQSRSGFGASFRVVAYSSAVFLVLRPLNWLLGGVGTLLALLLFAGLTAIGVHVLHRAPMQKAVVVAALLGATILFLGFGMLLVGIALFTRASF